MTVNDSPILTVLFKIADIFVFGLIELHVFIHLI